MRLYFKKYKVHFNKYKVHGYDYVILGLYCSKERLTDTWYTLTLALFNTAFTITIVKLAKRPH